MKRIKAKRKVIAPVREKFEVELTRNDRPEVHQFTAVQALDAASLALAVKGSGGKNQGSTEALTGMLRAIRKGMDDSDGVPVNWEPKPYEEPEPEPADDDSFAEVAEPADDDDNVERLFVGPDGEPITAEQVVELEKFERGSSRRRWAFLMESDDDVVVEPDVLRGVFELVVGVGANRPTRRSS